MVEPQKQNFEPEEQDQEEPDQPQDMQDIDEEEGLNIAESVFVWMAEKME